MYFFKSPTTKFLIRLHKTNVGLSCIWISCVCDKYLYTKQQIITDSVLLFLKYELKMKQTKKKY